MKKKIILSLAAVAAITVGVVGMSAFEAHIINVTAHIENALAVNTYGIDFGTVFPQEYVVKPFEIALSDSFKAAGRVDDVEYKLVQKDKAWTLNFCGEPVGDTVAQIACEDENAHNRSLLFVDPDQGKGEGYDIAGGKLTITTGTDVEDLFGPNEVAGDWTAPRMVFPMGGNFTIETKVAATPAAYPPNPYQSGGIIVYESNGNVVRLDLANFSGLGSTAAYMESQIDSVKTGKGWDSLGGATTVWLKLSRNGNTFKGEYSLDGITWNTVTTQEGTFVNAAIGNLPKVGLAVVDNNGDQLGTSFSADFDYVTFNGDYLSLCRFLSKTPVATETGDVEEPSYYIAGPNAGTEDDRCEKAEGPAIGHLSKIAQDFVDVWNVDLKVPPVSGFVGQDWPASCAAWQVEEDSMDYGCDIWVEVTGISEVKPQ